MAATIQIQHLLRVLALLTTWITFIIILRRQIKTERIKQDDRFALKENVDVKFDVMDKKILTLDNIVERNRIENLDAHNDLKNDIKKHFDKRIDDFKDYMKGLINSIKAS